MHRALRVAKDQHGAIPAGLLGDVTEFAMPALVNQAWRMTARLRLFERVTPFNLIISNVPGPSVPLYFAGARAARDLPRLGDHGRPGAQHHRDELRRVAALRAGRLPGDLPRPRADGPGPAAGARRAAGVPTRGR